MKLSVACSFRPIVEPIVPSTVIELIDSGLYSLAVRKIAGGGK